ncbi:MAG: hypothetical protein EXQ81_02160 [Thermoleophilia bacterium]|nr:hypothetical protein [Thermoleophilia bacterium]
MTRLYLHCGLCGHKQANGLLSGAAWRRTEVPVQDGSGAAAATLHACPSCVDQHADWQARLFSGLRPLQA